MVAEIGTFAAKADPARSTSDGGWDHQAVLGTVETKDRVLLAYLVAIKKGDEGGMVVALADGVETMTAYADAFAAMIRGMGGAKAGADPASRGGPPEHRAPAGWVETKIEGLPYLVKEKNEEWVKYRMSLLILPGEAFAGSVREQFEGFWRSYVAPNYATTVAPMPLVTRLGSGYRVRLRRRLEGQGQERGRMTVALYMIVHGGRAVPVLGVFSGPDWTFDKTAEAEIREFLETARIPGATAEKVRLFSADALAGEWSESSSEFANYVTRGGNYAGDATVSTGTVPRPPRRRLLRAHAPGAHGRPQRAREGRRDVDRGGRRARPQHGRAVQPPRLLRRREGGPVPRVGDVPQPEVPAQADEPAGHPPGPLDEGEVGGCPAGRRVADPATRRARQASR